MIKKWNEFNSINEKKDPKAPKFGTPEYWAYVKAKKKNPDTKVDDSNSKCTDKDCKCKDCGNSKSVKKIDKKSDKKKK